MIVTFSRQNVSPSEKNDNRQLGRVLNSAREVFRLATTSSGNGGSIRDYAVECDGADIGDVLAIIASYGVDDVNVKF